MRGLLACHKSRRELCRVYSGRLEEPVCGIFGGWNFTAEEKERYKLRKLVTRYFLHEGILFKKGYDGDPLRCLGPEQAKEILKEVHSSDCGEHQGRKKLYKCILQMGYYWPTIKRKVAEFVKMCHGCQVQANLIHTHP